jgi:hypothetical protein
MTPAPTPSPLPTATPAPSPTASAAPSDSEAPSVEPSDSSEPSESAGPSGSVDPESEAALRASLLTAADVPSDLQEQDPQVATTDTTPGFTENKGERIIDHQFTGTGTISSVYDFRWQFPSRSTARAFLKAASPTLSETDNGLKERTDGPGVGDEYLLYTGTDNQGLGLVFYNYLFRVQNVVAKVFVGGDASALKADDADQIAGAAADRMAAALEGPYPNDTEQLVLQYVPQPIQPSCARIYEFYAAEIDSVRCRPSSKPRVDYSIFQTKAAMDAAFDADLKASGAVKSGECSGGKFTGGYTISGTHAGRYMCVATSSAKYIEWTDEQLFVLSYAVSSTASWDDLQSFWSDEAGPEWP